MADWEDCEEVRVLGWQHSSNSECRPTVCSALLPALAAVQMDEEEWAALAAAEQSLALAAAEKSRALTAAPPPPGGSEPSQPTGGSAAATKRKLPALLSGGSAAAPAGATDCGTSAPGKRRLPASLPAPAAQRLPQLQHQVCQGLFRVFCQPPAVLGCDTPATSELTHLPTGAPCRGPASMRSRGWRWTRCARACAAPACGTWALTSSGEPWRQGPALRTVSRALRPGLGRGENWRHRGPCCIRALQAGDL